MTNEKEISCFVALMNENGNVECVAPDHLNSVSQISYAFLQTFSLFFSLSILKNRIQLDPNFGRLQKLKTLEDSLRRNAI